MCLAIVQLCYTYTCPPLQYRPWQDVLNAAQTGAMVKDLVSHEFNYLLRELRKVMGGGGVGGGRQSEVIKQSSF